MLELFDPNSRGRHDYFILNMIMGEMHVDKCNHCPLAVYRKIGNSQACNCPQHDSREYIVQFCAEYLWSIIFVFTIKKKMKA